MFWHLPQGRGLRGVSAHKRHGFSEADKLFAPALLHGYNREGFSRRGFGRLTCATFTGLAQFTPTSRLRGPVGFLPPAGAPIQLEEKYMQKKLIALAVAGLVSAPAFAQSNVTIYGTIDYGYVLQGKNIDSDVDSRGGLDSGVSKANRLGFKGVEDLGNGLKAVFVLESGLNGDNGGVWKGGSARQSYAGLAGAFGTVAFGRQYTPQHLFTSAVDPFGKNGLGSAQNVLVQDRRLDNLLAYISPTWGGFSFVAGWTNSYVGDESDGNSSENGDDQNGDFRVWAFAPSYTNGGLFVAGNFHQARGHLAGPSAVVVGATAPLDPVIKVNEGYISYDFNVVKIGGYYGQRKIELDGAPNIKVKQWLVGATVPFTAADKLQVSYSRRVTEQEFLSGGSDLKVGQWALGYEHALSKRTALYAQFAYQNHNSAQKDAQLNNDLPLSGPDASIGLQAAGVGSTYGGGDNYRRGVAVGLRHDF
jgi:predicted porin